MPNLQRLRQLAAEVVVREGKLPDRIEPAVEWAPKLREYAALAALAYPLSAEEQAKLPVPDWERTGDRIDDAKTSLSCEVWRRKHGSPVEIVIAYRGTQEAKDWWSNARWATRFIPGGPDQYPLVRETIAGLVDRAKARYGALRVVTVGHSLGGGLAQQAAYAHPEVKTVYAFDSSPVTGFKSVPQPDRDRNAKGTLIYRVYERGEILAYFRGFLREFVLPLSEVDPKIIEVRFNARQGRAIEQHSMTDLAIDLNQLSGAADGASA